ncbi:hypothetical protein U9M48_001578 [Paspalum notatum var. saurae]|uniref:Uncharacterized protein n=1 Tax=Paspalum notatum var. saurae TaxID=547442 RepID=A0AAQ3SGU0_PASNO
MYSVVSRKRKTMATPPPATGGRRTTASTISGDGGQSNRESTIAANVATGSHVLTIDGYSKTKVLGVGRFISSTAFVVGGHSWSIRYYPNGAIEDGWISVFLEPVDYEGNVSAEFSFSLLDQFRRPVPSPSASCWSAGCSTTMRASFSSKAPQAAGNPRFIAREDLESSPHLLKDDKFRVRCDVAVTVVEVHAEVPFLAAPSLDLYRHLGGLLDSGVGADVKFVVGGEAFAAHRAVLASRSSVFMAQLFGPMKEKKENETDQIALQIDDIDASAFRVMLRFIYTDTRPEMDGDDRTLMAQHLLAAADRYGLERLKSNCEDVLGSYIDVDTAATTLALAEQHGCHGLKEQLQSPGNMEAVMASDGFEHLRSSCPALLQELHDKKFAP